MNIWKVFRSRGESPENIPKIRQGLNSYQRVLTLRV